MPRSTLTWFVLVLAASASALHAGQSMAMKAYLTLKQDSDLYVGEGSAEVKNFADKAAALEAARNRAKANLVESIQVRISSETSESMKSEGGKVEEKVQSQTKSSADLKLENLKFTEFMDLPETGQWTVLATLSKEDYRRQLAGKATPVYRPQYGLKLGVLGLALNDFIAMENSGPMNGAPKDFPVRGATLGNNGLAGSSSGGQGSTGVTVGFNLEFVWKDYCLSLNHYSKETALFIFDPKDKVYEQTSSGLNVDFAAVGWQWIPWSWRVQPFFPLGLNVFSSMWHMYSAWGFGGSAGAGLRYWPSDSFSLEVCARYLQGFGAYGYYLEGDGKPLLLRPGQEAKLTLTGAMINIAIQWSGF